MPEATSSAPVATPNDSGLAPDSIAEVVTDDLVVRSLPGVSDASLIDPRVLVRGTLLFVVDGPVAADGFDWYQAVPFPRDLRDIPREIPGPGWVAAGRQGDPWIAAWSGTCPEPELESMWTASRFVLLACFGDRDLTLQGALRDCGGATGGPSFEPSWLTNFQCVFVPAGEPCEPYFCRGLVLRTPEVPHRLGANGTLLRVTGHFDDPVARTCIEFPREGIEPTPPELLVLECRAQFVVTEVVPLSGP